MMWKYIIIWPSIDKILVIQWDFIVPTCHFPAQDNENGDFYWKILRSLLCEFKESLCCAKTTSEKISTKRGKWLADENVLAIRLRHHRFDQSCRVTKLKNKNKYFLLWMKIFYFITLFEVIYAKSSMTHHFS